MFSESKKMADPKLISALTDFANKIKTGSASDQELLADLEKISSNYKDQWQNFLVEVEINNYIHGKANLLQLALHKNRSGLALKLIEYNVPVNDQNEIVYTALRLALNSAVDIQVIKNMIDKIPNFSYIIGKDNLLFEPRAEESAEVASLLLDRSQVKTSEQDLSIYLASYFLKKMPHNALLVLKKIENLDDMSDAFKQKMLGFITNVRGMYWTYPENNHIYDAICNELKRLLPLNLKPSPLDFNKDTHPISLETSYEELYGTKVITAISTKEEGTKDAIAQINCLLQNPKACIKYLKFINDQFKEFYKTTTGTQFPIVPADSYQFKSVHHLYYPMPQAGYKGIKKVSALQKFLRSRFSALHGVSGSAYKLIGFIPDEKVKEYLKKGSFSVEDTLGSGLYHGKMSHVLQEAIILCAIEDGTIQLKAGITVQEVLEGHVTYKSKDGRFLWNSVRDASYSDKLSFSDPFAIGSVVMHSGRELGFPELADSMTDSFCKGFLKQLEFRHKQPAFKNLSISEFFDKMGDQDFRSFLLDSEIVKAATEKEQKKDIAGKNVIQTHKQYSIFNLNERYSVNKEFKHQPMPRSSDLDASPTSPKKNNK